MCRFELANHSREEKDTSCSYGMAQAMWKLLLSLNFKLFEVNWKKDVRMIDLLLLVLFYHLNLKLIVKN